MYMSMGWMKSTSFTPAKNTKQRKGCRSEAEGGQYQQPKRNNSLLSFGQFNLKEDIGEIKD